MINLQAIMESWDQQQTAYIPYREARYTVMLDALEHLLGDSFTVLDLACGMGSISKRVLTRFPNATCIAADLDPVLMHIGQQCLGSSDRIHWLDVNLCHPDWVVDDNEPLEWLKAHKIDAVLSTTALHWLTAPELVRVYLHLGMLQSPGGLVMNGDHMMFLPHMTTFRRLRESVKDKRHDQVFNHEGQEDYAQWWEKVQNQLCSADPGQYDRLFKQREERFSDRKRDYSEPIRALHEAALSDAGYTEIAPIWAHIDDCVILAVRGPNLDPVNN